MGYLSSYSGQEIDNSISVNSTQNDRLTAIETSIQNLNNKIYPVGSIYISINSTSPASLFGGTWEQLKDRFLLAAGDSYTSGATGGEASHTLTTNEIPAHQHSEWLRFSSGSDASVYAYYPLGNSSGGYAMSGNTGNTGGGAAHNNMPPYLAVYMWKRIS